MASKSPDRWIEFVLEHAERLRAAGVARIEFDGCNVDLRPAPAPAADPVEPSATPKEYSDPLDDPHTFGLRGRVPAFLRVERDE